MIYTFALAYLPFHLPRLVTTVTLYIQGITAATFPLTPLDYAMPALTDARSTYSSCALLLFFFCPKKDAVVIFSFQLEYSVRYMVVCGKAAVTYYLPPSPTIAFYSAPKPLYKTLNSHHS